MAGISMTVPLEEALHSVDALLAPMGRNGPVYRDAGSMQAINSLRFAGRVMTGPVGALKLYLPDRRKLTALAGIL